MSFPAFSQENDYSIIMDTTARGYDKFMPTGIRIGADLLGPALYFFDNRNLNYEFTGEIDIDKYYLIAEVGFQHFREENENIRYGMQGTYFRIGPEVNFLHRDPELNNFSFGLRYAWASYNEKTTGPIEEPNWGVVPVDFDVDNQARWFEMTTGVKVRLYKGLFTGYVFRFRFLRKSTEPNVPFATYYIPGYGYADRKSTWGFRYYLMYRFQWDKKPIRPKVKN